MKNRYYNLFPDDETAPSAVVVERTYDDWYTSMPAKPRCDNCGCEPTVEHSKLCVDCLCDALLVPPCCPACFGEGRITDDIGNPCPRCNGSGADHRWQIAS